MSISWHSAEPAPALVVHPPDAASLDEAHAAIEQWEYYSGKSLDSAQRLAVEHMMAEKADGTWAARTTGRAEPRQNGKGDEIEVVEAWDLTQRGAPIVHTAHEIPTAKRAHLRLVGHLEGHRDLRRKVRQIRYANGDQSIELVNGGIVVYRTRTAGGGRGLDDIARLVVDEAQHAQPEQLASSTPILAVNPNPQTNFTGSAGIADKSGWWWTLRRRALLGGDGDFAWLEHSAEHVELNRDGQVVSTPPDPSDRRAWADANPAFPDRISADFLVEQLGTLGAALFAREHLCVWDPFGDQQTGIVAYELWQSLALHGDVTRPEDSAFALHVNPDRTRAAVGYAGRRGDGLLQVGLVDWRAGTSWVVDRFEELRGRWDPPAMAVDTRSEATLTELEKRGMTVPEDPERPRRGDLAVPTAADTAAAYGMFVDAVLAEGLRHADDGPVNAALAEAQTRPLAGGATWDHKSGEVGPLKAVTLALWAFETRAHLVEGDLDEVGVF